MPLVLPRPHGLRPRARGAAGTHRRAQAGVYPGSTRAAGASARHHPGPQRAHGASAGQRKRARPRGNCLLSHGSRRRYHVSRTWPACRVSHCGSAGMEARCGRLCARHRAGDHRHPGGVRHRRRPHPQADRRMGRRAQDRRHRGAPQPLGDFARVRLERYDGSNLFPVHCAVRAEQAGHLHGAARRERAGGAGGPQGGGAFRAGFRFRHGE